MNEKPEPADRDASVNETRHLLQRLLNDDPAAWTELVRQYSGILLATARRTFHRYNAAGGDADAEDAVAEAWRSVLAHDRRVIRQCQGNGHILPMLHTLTRNRAVDIIRSRKLATVPLEVEPAAEPPPAESWIPPDGEARVAEAIRHLSDREQTLLRLFYLRGMKYRDIEQLTGISINAIGPTLNRALAKIRARIAPHA